MRTLLLADDSVATQRVIALTFADEAFRVVTVNDGRQAIAQIAEMRPDIVLASTGLPRTSGYELSQYMLGVETLKHVPLLLLSGAFESVDEARLKSSGARGVIEKPLEPTTVINRVKELLGLKAAQPAPPTGRLLTPATTTADKKEPPRTPAPSPPAQKVPASVWDEPLASAGLDAVPPAVEDAVPGQGREGYLETLDTAFDSLDQHLAGRNSETPAHRSPPPPLDQDPGSPDSRSPGSPPAATSEGGTSTAVFEVDSDWFPNDSAARDRAAGHDILADAHEAMPPRAAAAPGDAIFEVDDEWFADDERARQSRTVQHRELAAEMGIHDLDLPQAEPVPTAPAPAEGLDFDFGLDDLARAPVTQEPAPSFTTSAPSQESVPVPDQVSEVPTPMLAVPPLVPPLEASDPDPVSLPPVELAASLRPFDSGNAGVAQDRPSSVADDFAALLAFETGDGPPPIAAPAVVQAAAPEITEAMLDQIAQRVADRLSAGTFGVDLREAMTATLRETVRAAVSETSERLVREEIARVKARAERDTH